MRIPSITQPLLTFERRPFLAAIASIGPDPESLGWHLPIPRLAQRESYVELVNQVMSPSIERDSTAAMWIAIRDDLKRDLGVTAFPILEADALKRIEDAYMIRELASGKA